jgi:hypothetical protein
MPESVQCLAFSQDGSRLALGLFNGEIGVVSLGNLGLLVSEESDELRHPSDDARIVDRDKFNQLVSFVGHKGEVLSLAFSHDGRRLVSGGDDCMVRVWDLESMRQLFCLQGQRWVVTSVAFSPDGHRVVGSSSRETSAWDAATGVVLEVREGGTDAAVFAGGSNRFPWGVLRHASETVLESASKGVPTAWFPAVPWSTTSHPDSLTHAGVNGNNLYFFKLEGSSCKSNDNPQNCADQAGSKIESPAKLREKAAEGPSSCGPRAVPEAIAPDNAEGDDSAGLKTNAVRPKAAALPTAKEIALLSRSAQVAFVAYCGRFIEVAFAQWMNVPAEFRNAVINLLDTIERADSEREFAALVAEQKVGRRSGTLAAIRKEFDRIRAGGTTGGCTNKDFVSPDVLRGAQSIGRADKGLHEIVHRLAAKIDHLEHNTEPGRETKAVVGRESDSNLGCGEATHHGAVGTWQNDDYVVSIGSCPKCRRRECMLKVIFRGTPARSLDRAIVTMFTNCNSKCPGGINTHIVSSDDTDRNMSRWEARAFLKRIGNNLAKEMAKRISYRI